MKLENLEMFTRFDFALHDDGSLDTVIGIYGATDFDRIGVWELLDEARYSGDYAAIYRDEYGNMPDEAITALGQEALDNMFERLEIERN